MSSSESLDPEPPFSELISDWLADGDRQSESAAAAPPEKQGPETIVTRTKTIVTRANDRIRHNPAASAVAACALLVFGASVLHHYARARVAGDDDQDRNTPPPLPLVVATAQPAPLPAAPPGPARTTTVAMLRARPVLPEPIVERQPPTTEHRAPRAQQQHHTLAGAHHHHHKPAAKAPSHAHAVAANTRTPQRHVPRSGSARIERATR
jgi:hypothetical protein